VLKMNIGETMVVSQSQNACMMWWRTTFGEVR
jgi:hypothetical protein